MLVAKRKPHDPRDQRRAYSGAGRGNGLMGVPLFVPDVLVPTIRSAGPAIPSQTAFPAMKRARTVPESPLSPLPKPSPVDSSVEYLVSRSKTPLLDVGTIDETLTADQKRALVAVAGHENVFLTGVAGGGKSRAVLALVTALEAAGTKVVVTATTAHAAFLLGGVTLHSYLCLSPHDDLQTCVMKARRYKKEELARLEVLVVDEVSMLSVQDLVRMQCVLRDVRGGMPVLVFVGDFCQAAPVQGDLLLGSKPWTDLKLHVVMLDRSFRQGSEEAELRRVLAESRYGFLSPASEAILKSRLGVRFEGDVRPTILTARRGAADQINIRELTALGPAVDRQTYTAKLCVATYQEGAWVPVGHSVPTVLEKHPEVSVQVPSAPKGSSHPPPEILHAIGDLIKNDNRAPTLHLAVGAQVVFNCNVSPGLVNGTRGVVTGFNPGRQPIVKLVNGESVTVEAFTRTVRVRTKTPGFWPSPCAFVYEQVPLQLGWALTIHKAQGMSIDRVEVDLGPSVFAPGMGYVALSRARTLAGLSLQAFHPRAVKAIPEVVAWYKSLKPL